MAGVISGDKAIHDNVEYVIVEVVQQEGDVERAVLRKEDDLDGLELTVAPVSEVKVIGHLNHIPGWVEESPGVWSQTP
jgi:hypothetical protein